MAVLPTIVSALDVPGPVVIAGNLDVVEPSHEPRYAVLGEWEFDLFRAFGEAGFDDAFRPSVSHHRGLLRAASLVHGMRDGRNVRYRLQDDHVARLLDTIAYRASSP
jgi:hypothetical protein